MTTAQRARRFRKHELGDALVHKIMSNALDATFAVLIDATARRVRREDAPLIGYARCAWNCAVERGAECSCGYEAALDAYNLRRDGRATGTRRRGR